MKRSVVSLVVFFISFSTIFSQEVYYLKGSTQKIEQLVGDFDRSMQAPTKNLTNTKYQIWGTDLGNSFIHKGETYFLFGDIPGDIGLGVDRDPIAYTNDTNPEDGLSLSFITQSPGLYQPITVPGISHGAFEVPVAGVSINDVMYVYLITDSKSVLARSTDDGQSFQLVEDIISSRYFVNVSVNKVNRIDYPDLPGTFEKGILVFGTGEYRKSAIYLYCQPQEEIENKGSIYYFSGYDGLQPQWSRRESDVQPIININCGGELSTAYNPHLEQWLSVYNCDNPRGINLRMANKPWGPYTNSEIIFEPWNDKGYCDFIHTNWDFMNCDSVHDPGRTAEWGGEYGPYLIKGMSSRIDSLVTIYYTMSTWNPYSVVLMKSVLVKPDLVSSVEIESDVTDFQVFPNPTTGLVNVKAVGFKDDNLTILLYDHTGKQIMSRQSLGEIDLSLQPNGIYFGQVFLQQQSVHSFKVIKNRDR